MLIKSTAQPPITSEDGGAVYVFNSGQNLYYTCDAFQIIHALPINGVWNVDKMRAIIHGCNEGWRDFLIACLEPRQPEPDDYDNFIPTDDEEESV